ncbi:MAG: DUF1080 domain-containing protein [Verrucomicrobiota bacterium]
MSNASIKAPAFSVAGCLVLLLATALFAGGCSTGGGVKGDSPAKTADAAAAVAAAKAAEDMEPDKPILPPGVSKAPAPFEGDGWREMFDGRDLSGWKATPFAGHGQVVVVSGNLVLTMGDPFTGVNWTNPFPTANYEIAFDAMRMMGTDFFCGLTLPMNDSHFSLILGGWGGSLVGISSINGMDASENETTKFVKFDGGQWYRVRMRVTTGRLETWVDDKKVVDLVVKDRKISLRPGDIEMSAPVGIAAWQTSAVFREIKWRPVTTAADPVPKIY